MMNNILYLECILFITEILIENKMFSIPAFHSNITLSILSINIRHVYNIKYIYIIYIIYSFKYSNFCLTQQNVFLNEKSPQSLIKNIYA
jgi:hypothetical protein